MEIWSDIISMFFIHTIHRARNMENNIDIQLQPNVCIPGKPDLIGDE